MNNNLDHLPASKRNHIKDIVAIIRDEFEQVVGFANGSKKRGKILKVILFGSHATGKWVKDPANGYVSDYDILIIVNQQELVDEHKIWNAAEDRIELKVRPPLNILVHTLSEVNNALHQGQYFFSDIRREGIVLYETDRRELSPAGNLSSVELKAIAEQNYDHWIQNASDFLTAFKAVMGTGGFKNAAFQLHQAAERFYSCLLLVLTNYKPNSHNLKMLNSLAISQDERITEVFPQETKEQRRCFQLLKKAYIDARYSKHYEIAEKELLWLAERVGILQQITEELCQGRIKSYGD